MDIQESISQLKKNKKVYIYDSDVYLNQKWQHYQNKEKKFWEYEVKRPDYNSNPKEHIRPSLKHWNIDTSYFKDKTVLEIGSGPFGFFAGVSQMNKGHLPKVLVMADSLMEFYQQFEISNLIPENAIQLQAPGEDMPLPDGSFDIILTNNTLDHVKNCDDFLKEIKRLLKPNGHLLFCAHFITAIAKPFKPIIKKIDTNHSYHFTQPDIEKLFDRHRFNLISKVSVPLYKEEMIPLEAKFFKKCIYVIGFHIMQTLYGVADLKRKN